MQAGGSGFWNTKVSPPAVQEKSFQPSSHLKHLTITSNGIPGKKVQGSLPCSLTILVPTAFLSKALGDQQFQGPFSPSCSQMDQHLSPAGTTLWVAARTSLWMAAGTSQLLFITHRSSVVPAWACGPLEMPCPHLSLHDCSLPFLHSRGLFPPCGNAACVLLGSRERRETHVPAAF